MSKFNSQLTELAQIWNSLTEKEFDVFDHLKKLDALAPVRLKQTVIFVDEKDVVDESVVPTPPTLHPSSHFKYDMAKEGWTLETPSTSTVPMEALHKLELVPFLEKEEDYVNGDELVKRATAKGASLGQAHGEYLLANSKLIPEEAEDYILVFLDDVWRDPDGDRYVFCLRRHDGRWVEDWDWLDIDFDARFRLVRPAS